MLTKESLNWSTSRIEDFYEVQKGRGQNELIEALTVLRESLGVDDEILEEFRLWIDAFAGDEHQGGIILGFLVGLMVFEHERY